MATIEELWTETPEARAERASRQTALSEWHTAWTLRQVAAGVDGPVPEGRKDPSDYNEHVPELEAGAAALDVFHARAREIMGLPPL